MGRGAKEIEAVLPRKDNGRRIKLKELAGGIGLSYPRVGKQVPILVGPRSELPEPIKIPAKVYDPVGTKLRVVGDAVPTQYGTERNVDRLVLPGEFVEYQGRSVLPEEENWEGRWAFDMFENLSVYQGLIVDDRGMPRYMIGWTKPTFKAMKHRRSPLVPVDFFKSLKSATSSVFASATLRSPTRSRWISRCTRYRERSRRSSRRRDRCRPATPSDSDSRPFSAVSTPPSRRN